MRIRVFLLMTALLMNLVSAKANSPATLSEPSGSEGMPDPEVANDVSGGARDTPTEVNGGELVSAGAARLMSQDKVFASAYFDTLSILGTINGCSDFFGGPAVAAKVFAELMRNVRKNSLPGTIGINMNGVSVVVVNERTKSHYRLFGNVLINSNGPFYRSRVPISFAPVPGVGTFQANTKEVRVLMFLHELGHAIKGDDGNWLLLDDGKDDGLSRKNSQKIKDVCGEQIKALRNLNVKHEAQSQAAHESKYD